MLSVALATRSSSSKALLFRLSASSRASAESQGMFLWKRLAVVSTASSVMAFSSTSLLARRSTRSRHQDLQQHVNPPQLYPQKVMPVEYTRSSLFGQSAKRKRSFSSVPGTTDQTLELHDDTTNDVPDADQETSTRSSEFATSYHAPVMWKECVDALLGRETTRKITINDDNNHKIQSNANDHSIADQQQRQPMAKPRLFVDGTAGGGGHSEALLKELQAGDIVFGCDVDPTALATAKERLKAYIHVDLDQLTDDVMAQKDDDSDGSNTSTSGNNNQLERPLFIPVHSNFCNLARILPTIKHPITHEPILSLSSTGTIVVDVTDDRGGDNDVPKQQQAMFQGVDGILLDLGVSSYQIDTPERGFAYRKDGPLDMRMNNQNQNQSTSEPYDGTTPITTTATTHGAITAADLINLFDESELARIFCVYGDESKSRARRIAASIVQHRPVTGTSDLVAAVAAVTPEFAKQGRRFGRSATLARVFQSIRIVVNQEDLVLQQALEEMAPAVLRQPGGRLVVLSYHSMEDRATKRMMRDGAISKKRRNEIRDEKDMYGNYVGPPRPFRVLGKPQKASETEVELNSRARSATLRVAERQ